MNKPTQHCSLLLLKAGTRTQTLFWLTYTSFQYFFSYSSNHLKNRHTGNMYNSQCIDNVVHTSSIGKQKFGLLPNLFLLGNEYIFQQ